MYFRLCPKAARQLPRRRMTFRLATQRCRRCHAILTGAEALCGAPGKAV
jgi:hypothetical protein